MRLGCLQLQMQSEIIIRQPDKREFLSTEKLTRKAFWNLYKPGCDEHLVLHQLRKSKCYIKELDFVAISEGKIIGHIISTKARVIDKKGIIHEVLCVGPFSVIPSMQNKGIGSRLMNRTIYVAKQYDYKGMILFGSPGYYHRFGFVNAQQYGITTKDDKNFEPFMALELHKKGLTHVKGRFYEDEAFTTNEEELAAFEKKFPLKEKGKAKIDISQQ
jgi:predicted N-acetyltransferase YhbS